MNRCPGATSKRPYSRPPTTSLLRRSGPTSRRCRTRALVEDLYRTSFLTPLKPHRLTNYQFSLKRLKRIVRCTLLPGLEPANSFHSATILIWAKQRTNTYGTTTPQKNANFQALTAVNPDKYVLVVKSLIFVMRATRAIRVLGHRMKNCEICKVWAGAKKFPRVVA